MWVGVVMCMERVGVVMVGIVMCFYGCTCIKVAFVLMYRLVYLVIHNSVVVPH